MLAPLARNKAENNTPVDEISHLPRITTRNLLCGRPILITTRDVDFLRVSGFGQQESRKRARKEICVTSGASIVIKNVLPFLVLK